MKHIVVGIDFSNGSFQALEYAIYISNKSGADISMLWVDNQTMPDAVFTPESKALQEEAKKNFDEVMRKYSQKLKRGKLNYNLKRGKVSIEIAFFAQKIKADLIVAGAHGVTGFEEYWIGSNANRIVMHAPCPVVTIRYNYDISKPVKNILMPVDSTPETIRKFKNTAIFAKIFDAEIHILALYNTTIKSLRNRVDNSAILCKNILEKHNVPYRFHSVEADSITSETLNYIENNDVTLVAIMTEQGSSYSGILLGQYAQQMVNYCPVPVFSIHPDDNFSI